MSVLSTNNINHRNFGENNHYQESWHSSNFGDALTKLYFQLVRQPKNNFSCFLIEQYDNLITAAVESSNPFVIQVLISILFQTRDIVSGKGEYNLFYNLLPIWDKYWNNINEQLLVKPLLMLFDVNKVNNTYDFDHPYGSWKDMKYIFNYYRDYYKLGKLDIIGICKTPGILSTILNIFKDEWNNNDSLMFKWLPREKSKKFGWQASILANHLYPDLSLREGLILYRKHCGKMNCKLETVQINQCAKLWSNIDFKKNATSLTISRQKQAFICKGRNTKLNNKEDRQQCKENFNNYLLSCKDNKNLLKVRHISLGEIVKKTISYNNNDDKEMINMMNLIWEQKIQSDEKELYNVIPILDLSISMATDNCPYYDAVGIALYIACKSNFKKRILTFDQIPQWVNLDNVNNISEMLKLLLDGPIKSTSNIYAAFKLIADVCIIKDLPPAKVNNMTFVIISDMQIDNCLYDSNNNILQENIASLFAKTGLNTSYKTPYACPTLVFWNMKSTWGFPCTPNVNNTFYVSGYNPNILSLILTNGSKKNNSLTAKDGLFKLLSMPRYSWFWQY